MSPALMNSSSSRAYTSRCLSSATCVTSLSFLRAFRNVQKGKPPAKVAGTTVRVSPLSIHNSSSSARIDLSSNNPDKRDCWVWLGIISSVDRRSVSVKSAAFYMAVPPGSACVSGLATSFISRSPRLVSDTIARMPIRLRPVGARCLQLRANLPGISYPRAGYR